MTVTDNFSNWLNLIQQVSQPEGITLGTSDLVKATGVPASQLRYWVEQGYIKPIDVPNERSRKFSYRVVFRVRAIKYFLDHGYTLSAAMDNVNQFRNLDIQLQRILTILDEKSLSEIVNLNAKSREPIEPGHGFC